MRNLRLFLAATLVALFASACGVLFDSSASTCAESSVALVRISPPAGAENFSERCSTGFNPTQNATFTITPDQLQAVQDSLPITDWQQTPPNPQGFADEAAAMTSYLYGLYSNGAVYVQVLIDTSDPALYTVYYSGSFVD